MLAQLGDVGAVICAAGDDLAPADKKLYALRDVTGTVEAIPLIASSIMSKKIAEGTGALVLDVKVGSGAFMKDVDTARELAATMVALGADHDVRTVALLTDMSTPLGLTAGNALEVRESVEVLAGGGPPDVVELTVTLAREMLAAAGLDGVDPADRLADGSAMDVWKRMIRAQGGDPDAPLPTARETQVVAAPADGVLVGLDAYAVGVAAWRLGAGRARKEDPVQAGRGRRDARQAGRRGARRRAAVHAAHRRAGPVRPGRGGARGRRRHRPRGLPPGPARPGARAGGLMAPQLIAAPTRIPVPGGKVIDEYVGRVTSADSAVSVAHMQAPAGWSEPAQTPEFDEVTLVLSGSVVVEHDGGRLEVPAGQAVITRSGERVRYLVGAEGAEYVAVCLPAFDPDLAHRDPDDALTRRTRRVMDVRPK